MHPDNISRRYPSLTPEMASWMEDVIQNRKLLAGLFEEYGSPINLHHTGPFKLNYEAYRAVLDRHKLRHTVLFARKANKCLIFAKEAQRIGFGVDTASYRELNQCLEAGCDPERLVLTAAVKNERLMRLALRHNVLMILDNEDECRLVNRLAGELDKTPLIGIRISGFKHEGEKLYSRFGFDIDDVKKFIIHNIGPEKKFYNLRFGGFHFHLDGYSVKQRGSALVQTINLVDGLQSHGIRTLFIDIGGGLLMRYLSDKKEWEMFWRELKKAVRGEREPITFGNNGLGYELVDGKLLGKPNVYPYYNQTPKGFFLNAVLSYEDGSGQTTASMLRQRDIELRMEPGRSLLDQTGMTIGKVAFRKKDQRNDWLVGLEMNRSQLSSSSADFLLDPVFIPMQSSTGKEKPTPVYLTGGYCLEQDILLKRKIVLPTLPEIGDIICFTNTAGYMMHFYETQSHLYEFASNLVMGPESRFIED